MIETIQRDSSISFPMFGDFTINPPSYITVFGRNIYFYGIIIAVAFMLGILYSVKNAKKVGLTEDDIYDSVIWMIPMSIIGARLYFVLFNLKYYIANPAQIIAVWEGGLAIYGGVIMGLLVVYLVSKSKKIPFLAVVDILITACILGQAIGRWGNFMNREAFGSVTDVFCKMGLTSPNGTTIYVHPTFLYESVWNFIGFLLINNIIQKGKHKYNGECLYLYCCWYGLGRSFIEGLRTDSLYIGSTGIRVSQLLSVALVVFGSVMLYINHKRINKGEESDG